MRSVVGYAKGRPTKIQLVMVDWTEVELRTARAYRKMRDAAERDGIVLEIRSGFRSHEQQMNLYQRWRAGWGNMAAKPGFSNHQAGRAIDLVVHDPTVLAWLTKHAPKYGFWRTVRSEPWHWEFRPIKSRRLRR